MNQHTLDQDSSIQLVEHIEIIQPANIIFESIIQLPPETHLLHIDYHCPPQQRFRQWLNLNLDRLVEGSIIYTGYALDEYETVDDNDLPESIPTPDVCLADPTDLPRIGLKLVKYLQNHGEDPGSIILCVHSLSLMLQYNPESAVVQFVNECIRLCERYGVITRFHFTPTLHSAETADRFQALFE